MCSFGLIFGRSGSGKTTLLQVHTEMRLEVTSPSTLGWSIRTYLWVYLICIQKYDDSGNPIGMSEMLTSQRVGIVFQFPERFELFLS